MAARCVVSSHAAADEEDRRQDDQDDEDQTAGEESRAALGPLFDGVVIAHFCTGYRPRNLTA